MWFTLFAIVSTESQKALPEYKYTRNTFRSIFTSREWMKSTEGNKELFVVSDQTIGHKIICQH